MTIYAPNMYDWTPVYNPPPPPDPWDIIPMPPFDAVPGWDLPPDPIPMESNSLGTELPIPLNSGNSGDPTIFFVGPGTGHFGW